MYSILIADEDDTLLDALKQYFLKFSNNLKLYTARNGRDAVRVLKMNPVDLVAAELMLPETDGVELFSFMDKNFPSIPIIVMSGSSNPETKEKLKSLGSPIFLSKPLKFDDLQDAIFTRLQQVSDKGLIAGVSLTSFIQYISLEGKTCLIEAKVPGKSPGCLYFNKGRPWDAIWEDMRGQEAAVEIIGWEKVEIRFKRLPAKRIKRRIAAELMGLIVEAVRHREERAISKKLVQDNEVNDLEAVSISPIDEMSSIDEQDIVDELILEAISPDDDQEEYVIEPDNALSVLNEEKQVEVKIIQSPVLESEVLAGFLNIPGVEAVLVVGNDGTVVQSSAQACHIDMEKTGASSATMWNGIAKMGRQLGIYGFQSLMLESDDAVIVGTPINDHLLVILARDARKLGMIRMRIKKQMPGLEKEIRNQRSETNAST